MVLIMERSEHLKLLLDRFLVHFDSITSSSVRDVFEGPTYKVMVSILTIVTTKVDKMLMCRVSTSLQTVKLEWSILLVGNRQWKTAFRELAVPEEWGLIKNVSWYTLLNFVHDKAIGGTRGPRELSRKGLLLQLIANVLHPQIRSKAGWIFLWKVLNRVPFCIVTLWSMI